MCEVRVQLDRGFPCFSVRPGHLGQCCESEMARRGTCHCHIPEPAPSAGCSPLKRVLSEKSIRIFLASLPPAARSPVACVCL